MNVQGSRDLPKAQKNMVQSQQQSLQKLLHYVWHHSTFYRDYYSSYGIQETDLADLTIGDLPFLSKKVLMENFDTAVTQAQLRRQEIEQWLEENRDPQQNYRQDFIIVHSSGSTGQIGIFVYDRTAWHIMNSTMATRLPVPPPDRLQKTRVACLLQAHGHFGTPQLALRLPRAAYDVLLLSIVEDTTAQVVEQLHALQPHRLVGYPSVLTRMAELALQGQLQIRPQRIFAEAEPLTGAMEHKLHQAWGVPIHDLYGASESLHIAIKESGQDEMAVMDDLNILEVLDEQHQPVSPGGYGRTVLTNLYNYTLPILRYELGDYVTRGLGQPVTPFSTIRQVRGRVNEALPIVLDNGMHDVLYAVTLTEFYTVGLEGVQFISQRPDHIQIDYVASHPIDESVRQEFQRLLTLKGASRTTFDVRRVPHIANDPHTGKRRLVRFANAAVRAPERTVVRLASPAASHRRGVGPTNTFSPFRQEEIEQSIPARFEQQVQRYADRQALKSGHRVLTYEALNRTANRLAHAILAQRPGGEESMALLLEHGIPMITGMLGTLKAGKIYVPLDPSFPVARTVYMVQDAGAQCIVTDNKHLHLAYRLAQHGQQVLNIDALDACLSSANPGLSLSPDTLASILYTSGTSGDPKGVIQNHRNMLHLIMTYTNDYHICTDDRLSHLHSCTFSATVREVFGALLNGAMVSAFHLKEQGLAPLADWMIREGITIYYSVPTVFRHFARTLTGTETFPRLRLIRLGGEPVSKHDVELFKAHFPQDCLFVNALASSETATTRQYFIDQATPITGSVVPVGYAVQDQETLLLDETGKAVGVDQIGEIAVKSRYLALGYWRKPDLTQAAFLGVPEAEHTRIYRTGDLGLMRPNGCLEYCGRKDFQVKIRGHRIEIEEIELALLTHDAIKEAVVVAEEALAGEQRLVAYLVLHGEVTPDSSELRRFLAATLPTYMIPAVFVWLPALPLTPNGKVDRRALPAPPQTSAAFDDPFAAPCSPIEQQLADIWASLLGLQKVGRHDNFFDLGGHSLTAAQIASRVRDILHVDVPLRALLEASTVAAMAAVIVQYTAAQSDHNTLIQMLAEIETLSEE